MSRRMTARRRRGSARRAPSSSARPMSRPCWPTGSPTNPIYGRTNNPWDTSRTPGGSSGGSAAALAAGLTALEVGSDIGGSIRVPAAFCGVYGHRPSETLVPKSGQFPMPPIPNAAVVMGVQGPMARSAEDLELALSVLAGPDVGEDVAWRVKLPAPRHKRLADFRVAVLPPIPWHPVDGQIEAALEDLASRLGRLGCTVRRAQPEIWATTAGALRAVPLAPVRGDERARGRGDAPPAGRDMVREARTTSSRARHCAASRGGRATTSRGMAGASSSARRGARSSRSGTCCWPRRSTCSRIRTSSAPGRRMTAT